VPCAQRATWGPNGESGSSRACARACACLPTFAPLELRALLCLNFLFSPAALRRADMSCRTPARLHACTPARLHACTPARLHACTPALHTCPAALQACALQTCRVPRAFAHDHHPVARPLVCGGQFGTRSFVFRLRAWAHGLGHKYAICHMGYGTNTQPLPHGSRHLADARCGTRSS